ncbi:MAG: hypothetical protein KAT68_17570 [Bacteroidales bacterium]|nr:hypothetical protein [Bacteroidales bacterium]
MEVGLGLKLNISDNDNSLDLNLALDVAKYFRLNKSKSYNIIAEVKNSVKNWRLLAKKYKISKTEQELMSNAFHLAK